MESQWFPGAEFIEHGEDWIKLEVEELDSEDPDICKKLILGAKTMIGEVGINLEKFSNWPSLWWVVGRTLRFKSNFQTTKT